MSKFWATWGLMLTLCTMVCGEEPSSQDTDGDGDEVDRLTHVDPELLKDITIPETRKGIREEEVPAYFHLLRKTATVKLSVQKEAAKRFQAERIKLFPAYEQDPKLKFPTYRDLYNNPLTYKGKLVTLRGHTQLARQFAVTEKQKAEYDFETLYELWLYTDDAQTNPAVLICSELPNGFPLGDKRVENVTVTGYFFKKYGYGAQDTTRLVPLILSGTVQWKPMPEEKPFVFPDWGYGVIALILLGVVGQLWRTSKQDRSVTKQRYTLSTPEEPQFPTVEDEFSGLLESSPGDDSPTDTDPNS